MISFIKINNYFIYVERDLVRQLIVRALDGLGEGERFRTQVPTVDVDMDTLNNYISGFVLLIFFVHS